MHIYIRATFMKKTSLCTTPFMVFIVTYDLDLYCVVPFYMKCNLLLSKGIDAL
jgi:hypothetical protein